MRKITLLLAILALAALPSTADAAKKRKAAAKPAPAAQPANPNEAGARFVRDAFPVFLPSWAIPIYLSTQTEGPHAWKPAEAAQGKPGKQAKRLKQSRRAQ